MSDIDYDFIDEFNSNDEQLEIMNLSPMTDSRYVLFVRESYHSAGRNEDEVLVKLSDVTGKEREWREMILLAGMRNSLPLAEPDWYFATMFS